MMGAFAAVGPKLVSLFGHHRGPESHHHRHHQYPIKQSMAVLFFPPIRGTLRPGRLRYGPV